MNPELQDMPLNCGALAYAEIAALKRTLTEHEALIKAPKDASDMAPTRGEDRRLSCRIPERAACPHGHRDRDEEPTTHLWATPASGVARDIPLLSGADANRTRRTTLAVVAVAGAIGLSPCGCKQCPGGSDPQWSAMMLRQRNQPFLASLTAHAEPEEKIDELRKVSSNL